MKKGKKGIGRSLLSIVSALAIAFAMFVPVWAADSSEAFDNGRKAIVQVRTLYDAPDGEQYDILWGTGFLINDTTILTAYHVVDITYPDGGDTVLQEMREDEFFGPMIKNKTDKQVKEKIVYKIIVNRDSGIDAEFNEPPSSRAADVAVLNIKSPLTGYEPLALRDSENVKTEECAVLGFPGKIEYFKPLSSTYTQADVNAKPTSVSNNTSLDNGVATLLLNDLLSDGYSGGPVIDEAGNVIGLATGDDRENMALATGTHEFIKNLTTLGIKFDLVEGDAPAAEETTEAVEETTTAPPMPEPEVTEEKESGFPMLPVIIGIIAAAVAAAIVILLVTRKKKAEVPTPVTAVPSQTPPVGPAPAIPPAAGATTAPKVPPAYSGAPDTGVLGQGSNETTVLGQGSDETTVLSATQAYGTLTREKTGEKISINRDNFKIGRERSRVDYCISDNTAVGRHHATIVSRNGEMFIVDQNSRNFTFINDVKVTPNAETKINSGDKISLGDEVFIFNA